MAVRGPQAGPVIFNYTGIDAITKNLQALQSKLETPDMSAPVRGAARVWQENFDHQGWQTGNWKELSEFTQATRSARGYGATRPILHQSGGLRKAAADYPAQFKGKTMSRSTPATPGSYGTATSIVIQTIRNRATLTLTGSKVANQYGGINNAPAFSPSGLLGEYSFKLPKRRFWYINDTVRNSAVLEIMDTLRSLDIFK
jgi:hypothetical protein